ncbi:MAG: TRAP transporter small permease [Gammaproteobacteria bacterium]|nr:TRAP transporter small permease [Gammaproteobacteria bacterium]
MVLFLHGVGAVTLLALMLITCVDVFGRYLFNNPLTGSTELTEIAVGIVIFSVLPVVSWRNDHVVVDILDHFFSRRIHMIRTIVINLLISVALVFLGQRIYVLGQRSLSYGEVTEYLEIPLGWMMIYIAVMCWITALAVVTLGVVRAIFEFREPANPVPYT